MHLIIYYSLIYFLLALFVSKTPHWCNICTKFILVECTYVWSSLDNLLLKFWIYIVSGSHVPCYVDSLLSLPLGMYCTVLLLWFGCNTLPYLLIFVTSWCWNSRILYFQNSYVVLTWVVTQLESWVSLFLKSLPLAHLDLLLKQH